ncbi:hypothetical protein ACVIIV_003244 [Bradyrhizobium sp. USDA 4354]
MDVRITQPMSFGEMCGIGSRVVMLERVRKQARVAHM